ncbi:MAG: DUF4037 domain-containing protein [Bacilli bacterium]|nr:DUF4037 domain-containing protein [Bacilli bacterium]
MSVIDKNRRFYEEKVAKMIHDSFPQYEDRIAVGLVGEGSDCFGYDDEISRDHDFGTGVCLWLNDEDMALFGAELSKAYRALVDEKERSFMTKRLMERRGVTSIHDFYSDILGIDCDTKGCRLSENDWYNLDHSCLKTATNGVVFKDDLGEFTAFRNYLLGYYPESVWRRRLAEELHKYSSSIQVNYSRAMARGDVVAASLCKGRAVEAAMELFFLLNREYPPYYKWTFHALREKDADGEIANKIGELATETICLSPWEGTKYLSNRMNFKDRVVSISEELASLFEALLLEKGLISRPSRYLEAHVDALLGQVEQK